MKSLFGPMGLKMMRQTMMVEGDIHLRDSGSYCVSWISTLEMWFGCILRESFRNRSLAGVPGEEQRAYSGFWLSTDVATVSH
jgi:hypothetical protein